MALVAITTVAMFDAGVAMFVAYTAIGDEAANEGAVPHADEAEDSCR
jgi:hypothetical protein